MSAKKVLFKKGKVKLTSVIGLLIILSAIIAGLYLVKQNQNINEDAAENGCKTYKSARECSTSCSPTKKDGKSYQCRFTTSGNCIESSNLCASANTQSFKCKSNDTYNCTIYNPKNIKDFSNMYLCVDGTDVKVCCADGYTSGGILYSLFGFKCIKK